MGAPAPTVTLAAAAGSISHPVLLAFDRSGDLWVTNSGVPGTVVEFTASQLAASGTPTPSVTLTTNGSNSLNNPGSLAFGPRGGLWVGNDGNNTVVNFTPAQLSVSGNPTPAVTLTSTVSGSINTPDALAFDRTGNLWVANDILAGSLVAFGPSQLASSGAPVPTVTLSSNGTNLASPDSLTFDPFGNLWVSNFFTGTGGSVVEFAPTLLAASGTPTPTSTLSAGATRASRVRTECCSSTPRATPWPPRTGAYSTTGARASSARPGA